MIVAVLDTNVLVSGFPARTGVPAMILDAWRQRTFRLVVSETILEALAETWQDPYWRARFAPEDSAEAISLLRAEATVTAITVEVAGVATHPEDDLILATTVFAGATVLVTGDRRLRALGQFRGVAILTPREFHELLTKARTESPKITGEGGET